MKRRNFLAAALPLGLAGFPLGRHSTALAEVAAPPGSSLGFASVPNLRDLGGYPTPHGMVRRGLVYRSEKLHPVTTQDMPKLAALDLTQVFDLRTQPERAQRPDELMLPSARKSYRTLFLALSNGAGPQLFHCTAGKDRTGWGAAALLTLLGVPEHIVYQDYLRTNDYILPEYQAYIARFTAQGGDPAIAQDLFAAKSEYLHAAFREATSTFGSMTRYFEEGLGLDTTVRKHLRSRLIATA